MVVTLLGRQLFVRSQYLILVNRFLSYEYKAFVQTADYLRKIVKFTPKIGIICGSGLGSLADTLSNPLIVPYKNIPNFPLSTVEGHAGQLVFGCLADVPIVCMQGRFHHYEGYPLWKCAFPVRVMKLIGVTHLIVTNAAGGINKNYKVGDIMLIKDHINIMGFAGNNPLQGPNLKQFGPRFPPMNIAYNKAFIKEAKKVAIEAGFLEGCVHEGVYNAAGGPNYETVAELKMLAMLGVDAVGMSTIPEVITARHCEMEVFAFSLITNVGITDYDCIDQPNHEEVTKAAEMREPLLKRFVTKMVEYMDKEMLTNEK